MKIIIIFIDLLMATVLFFVGRFFIKSRNTERSVLFLSGDYTGLNTEKICRVTGKRIKTWAMLFCLGGIIDFIKPGAGIIIVSVFFIILLATVYKGNIIKNLIMDCQSYTKYRPNETTGGIFVSWRRKEELPTGA